MKRRVVSVVVGVLGVATMLIGVGWMLVSPVVTPEFVDNAQVAGFFLTVAGFLVTVAVVLRPADGQSGFLPVALSAEEERAAVEHLAREMTWVWRGQAHLQGIRRVVAPVAVRWRWADEQIAAPPDDFRRVAPDLRTEGTIGELASALYGALPADTRIVLLGQAGAGKTGAVLTLLLDALAARRAEPDQPVPVLLSLGGWNLDKPLADWAAETIARDYRTAVPGAAPAQVAAELMRRERVALFLDGLDEMPEPLRGRALKAIDDQGLGLRIVLTSRRDEYEAAIETGQLSAAAVVELQPPDPGSIEDFFVTGLVGARRALWQELAAHLREHPGSTAAQALNTPLALTLARQTYHADGDPTELIAAGRFETPGELLDHLVARFLDQAYPDEAERENARYWLSWIAHRLDGTPDIAWWHIPSWLPSLTFSLFYGLIAGIGSGTVVALGTALAVAPGRALQTTTAVNDGWVVGLVVGLVVAVLVADPTALWPRLSRSYRRTFIGTFTGMMVGGPRSLAVPRSGVRALAGVGKTVSDAVTGGVAAALGLGGASAVLFLVVGYGQTWPARLWYGVLAGILVFLVTLVGGVLALGFLNLFTRGLTDSVATTPARSYAADRAVSGLYAAVLLLFGGVAVAALFGLHALDRAPLGWLLLLEPSQRFVTWLLLAVGLGGGLAVMLSVGLATHAVPAVRVAEILLWIWYGRRVRFRALLETALARQVLRQAGAVYQFRHAEIQKHLTAPGATPTRRSASAWLRPVLLALGGVAAATVVLVATVEVMGRPFMAVPGYRDTITAFAVAPDGATAAAGGYDHAIRIVDVATGALFGTLRGHTGDVTGLAFTPDGGTLASRGKDGTLRLWDTRAGRPIHTIQVSSSAGQIVVSPDGKVVAAADGTSVRLWDAATGTAVRSIGTAESTVKGIAYAAGGRTLLTVDVDYNVTLWDPATGARGKSLPDGENIAVSRDGSTVAVDGAATIQLLDGATGDRRREIKILLGWPAALSPDGAAMAGTRWGNLWLLDTSTGEVRRFAYPDSWRPVGLSFALDGKAVAAAVDQRVVVWDAGTGRITHTICLAVKHKKDRRYADCG